MLRVTFVRAESHVVSYLSSSPGGGSEAQSYHHQAHLEPSSGVWLPHPSSAEETFLAFACGEDGLGAVALVLPCLC